MPDKVSDTNTGDFQGRAELFCLLLSEVGFKPYLLRHGAGREVSYVATIDVTANELKSISAELGKELKTKTVGELNLLPVSLYDAIPIGAMPAGVVDEKGCFVSRVEVRKMRPFRLPKTAPEADVVAGHVLEQDNRPVKGMEVRLVYVDLKYATKFFDIPKKYNKKCVTDEHGAFRFTGLVDGIYNMHIRDPKTGFELDEARFIRSGTNVVNVVLAPVKTTLVKVVDEDDKPVAGAGVNIYLDWHAWRGSPNRNRVITNANGIAKLTYRSAYEYSMILQHRGYADTYYAFDGFDSELTRTVQRGTSFKGRILLPPGNLKGLGVCATIESSEVDLKLYRYARIDDIGRFSFANLPPGKVTIQVRLGYPTICQHVFDPDADGEIVFDLSKATTVSGTVCVKGRPKPCGSVAFTNENGLARFAKVGKDGSFTVPLLVPGDYTVTSYDRRVRTEAKKITVEAGKKLELTLKPL